MSPLSLAEIGQDELGMVDRPKLFDALTLAALPTAVSCARMFTRYTLTNWGATFVLADALIVTGELVAAAVRDTGIADPDVRWLEITDVNVISVCLLGYAEHIVVVVWDDHPERAVLPPRMPGRTPRGLHLVDVTARRWGSACTQHGRLTWAELAVHDRTESGLPIRRLPPETGARPLLTEDELVIQRVMSGLRRM